MSREGHVPGLRGGTAARRVPLFLDPNLLVVYGITLMPVMAVSGVAPAFPAVAEALSVPPESTGLLITAFTLPGILLAPFLGILADRWGRKQVILPALVLFALAGAACAWAEDLRTLLALRFLQGLGGASLGSLSAIVVGDLFQGREQVKAMGYNAATLSLGSTVLPSLGGALALWSWRAPLALPLLALLVAAAVAWRLDALPTPTGKPFRAYLREAAGAMGARPLPGLYFSSLVTFIVLYGAYTVFIPILLHQRFEWSPLAIGLTLSGGSFTTAVTAITLGFLAGRYIPQRLVITAFLLYGLAFASIPLAPSGSLVALGVALVGVAQGLNYPVVLSLLATLAPDDRRGVVVSVNGTVIRTGQTLGPLLAGGVYAMGGMTGVFLSAAGLCAAVFLGLARLLAVPSGSPRKGEGKP